MIKLICAVVLLGTVAVGYRDFQSHIPNGERVPDPCHPNKLWKGVGHKILQGGGERNPFGKDFEAAGKQWTRELCMKDSDEDGKTNGEELGDPNCTWSRDSGLLPEKIDGLSHPGVCDPHDAAQCKAMNSWTVCQEQEFICPEKDAEGVIKQTFRMTRSNMPPKETVYQCQYLELPADRDYHLIAAEPYIDNANIMHHIIARGCPDTVAEKVKEKYSEPRECGMIQGECGELLMGWTLGMTGVCYDVPAGIRFGKTRFSSFIFEFHWTNPQLREDFWDSSGMTYYFTPNLREHDIGTLATGQMHLLLPPNQETTVQNFCPAECVNRMLEDKTIYLINGLHHMHLLGRSGYVFHQHDGKNDTLIDEPYFSYDSPKMFQYKPLVELKPGDELLTTCTFNTKTRDDYTYFGDGTFDEMCFGVFSYYPAEEGKFLQCVTTGDATCEAYDDTKCDFEQVTDNKDKFISGLYDFCDPTGLECSKCCLLYLRSELKGHPCWRGLMREMAQFVLSDGWDDKNVTNMLLTCEHQHDLDVLLRDDNIKISGATYAQQNFFTLVTSVVMATMARLWVE